MFKAEIFRKVWCFNKLYILIFYKISTVEQIIKDRIIFISFLLLSYTFYNKSKLRKNNKNVLKELIIKLLPYKKLFYNRNEVFQNQCFPNTCKLYVRVMHLPSPLSLVRTFSLWVWDWPSTSSTPLHWDEGGDGRPAWCSTRFYGTFANLGLSPWHEFFLWHSAFYKWNDKFVKVGYWSIHNLEKSFTIMFNTDFIIDLKS